MSKRIKLQGAHRIEQPEYVVSASGHRPVEALDPREYYQTVSRPEFLLRGSAWRHIAKRLYIEYFFRGLMDRGAILSFFTLLTTVPTLMAFYAITTLVLDKNRTRVTEITDQFISDNIPERFADEARQIVEQIIGSTDKSVVTLIVSVIFALFSSSAYVRAFSRSANALYGRQEGRSLARTWLTMWGLTIALVMGLVLIAIAFFLRADVLQPVLNAVAEPLNWEGAADFVLNKFLPVWGYLRWPVVFGLSIMLIAALYHVAPNVRYGRMRFLTTGSVFALATMTLVAIGVRTYLNRFLEFGTYGALGGLIALFMGLVIANTLLLMGLKLDAEITRFRELQAGMASEDVIQVPPRSSAAAFGQDEIDDKLRADARGFRDG